MYLLDTHAFIWTLGNDENLSRKSLNIIHSQSEIFVSMATFWEIAIKQSIKKLNIEDSIEDLGRICQRLSIKILPIELRHIERTKALPQIHRDPFDRLLIAQAQIENFTLITRDTIIPQYDVKTLW